MTATRTKINLPKVEPFFPPEMAESGRRVDKVLAQLAHDASVINADGAAGLAAHLADHANPHVVTKAQVGLALVENTALSTWAGSANITTLGTIGTGTWNATAIAWAKVDKSGSSLADLATRSAADLSSGVLADARVQQSNVTQHQAALAIAYTQLTYSALTTGAVLRATGATTAAFGAVDLANASAVTGILPWANVSKTGSSLADLTTRSAADLSSGVLVDARVQQSNVTQHQAALAIAYSQLTGIVPTWNQNTTGSAAKLTMARAIGGVSFDGTADITVATATGGFTVSGGALALGANDLTMTGSLGATGARLTKGWFTDLQVTNAIAGSITGSAPTLTNMRTIWGQNFNGSANVSGAFSGASTMSWSGDVLVNITQVATLNSRVGLTSTNSSAGTSAETGNILVNDAGKSYAVRIFSSGNTDAALYGLSRANRVIFEANGAPLLIGIRGGTDSMSFATNEIIRLTIDGASGAATFAGDLLFTDATFDIGKSGATRPRDGFFSRNFVAGGTGTFNGQLTVTTSGVAAIINRTDNAAVLELRNGGVTGGFLGTSAANNITFYDASAVLIATMSGGGANTLTLAADLKFTDATYDIGKSGATRPRDIFTSRNATIGGGLIVTGSSGGYSAQLNLNQNNITSLNIANTTSSTAAEAAITLSPHLGEGELHAFSDGYTTAGAYQAGACLFVAIRGPLNLAAINGSNGKIRFFTGGSADTDEKLNIAVGGLATFKAAVQTGAPSGGTAKPWKFGSVITGEVGLALNTTSHVELDVNGTLVKLALIL